MFILATQTLLVSTLHLKGIFTYAHPTVWNKELLYVGGFLCRLVYEFELSKINGLWEEASPGEPQRQVQERFIHVLKFFTFHHSTPSSKVADLLSKSFYGCSTLPLSLLSSVGVRRAPEVKAFDAELAKFLKSIPMLSEYIARDGALSISKLPPPHNICAITPSDVLRNLRLRPLDAMELVACLYWWITSGCDDQMETSDLFDAATFRGRSGTIHLSSITHFIDSKTFGPYIPFDGPLPLSLIPLNISKHFHLEDLARFGWDKFTVVSWLQHISRPDVMSANEKYDFARSVDWASRVLTTLCHEWPQLSRDMQNELRKMLRNKPCIPTSKGLYCPEHSYLPITENALFHHLDLPIVNCDLGIEIDEGMLRFLLFIGVRKSIPVQFLLDR